MNLWISVGRNEDHQFGGHGEFPANGDEAVTGNVIAEFAALKNYIYNLKLMA